MILMGFKNKENILQVKISLVHVIRYILNRDTYIHTIHRLNIKKKKIDTN